MVEKINYESEQKEMAERQTVGLRLQDIILRENVLDPGIISLRSRVLARLEIHPEEEERITVLNVLCGELMGCGLDEIKIEAGKVLLPYQSNGEKRKTLIISSASSASASQETECGILASRGHVIDIPGAIEGRDTCSACKGDVALISTKAGLAMAKVKDAHVINLADEVIIIQPEGRVLKGSDVYYKADGLLMLMLVNPGSGVITQLLNELADNPLVYPYNLDEETQIALLWLAKKAGLQQINVNANSPEVAVELTRKGFKYPTVEDALRIPYFEDPYEMQAAEWKYSQAAKEINHHPDCVPGYVVTRPDTYEELYKKSLTAFMLLAIRYDFKEGWLKPDRGTDGGNQGSVAVGLMDNFKKEAVNEHLKKGEIQEALSLYERSLPDLDKMTHAIEGMWNKGGDWVVEAKTNYFAIKFIFDSNERVLMTTPSVHVIKGEPRYTISLQLVDGVAWGGNLICSYETWKQLVGMISSADTRIINEPNLISQLQESYNLMTKTMHRYVEAVNSSEKYRGGQVRGGADLAIATLGGKFGENNLVIAVQDYNARANGCETAYALYDQAQEIYEGKGEAITRNITPKVSFDDFSCRLAEAVKEVNLNYGKSISLEQVKLIAVSSGWGQLGIIGRDALEIMEDIFLLEGQLRKMNMIL